MGCSLASTFLRQTALLKGKKQQWDRLEALRGEMRRQWERLRDLPLVSDDLETFCDTALFAYRNALAGLVPTDLPKIVGLCSLSYAVSRILQREGTSCSVNFIDDVRVCLQSLEKQEERQRIEADMTKLWPPIVQVDQAPHVGLTPQHQDWPQYPRSNAPQAYPSVTSPETWQIQDVPSMPYPSATFDALPGGFPVTANWVHTSQGRPFEPFGAAVDTNDYSVLGWIPGGTLNGIADTPWSDPDRTRFQVGAFGQLENTSQSRAASSAPNGPQHLQDTELFKTIGTFLDDSSDFLTLLSGNGVTAKNLDSCLSSSQERSTDKECLQSLYMDPLLKRQELLQAPCPTILSITKKFVGYGFLQSVDEAQYFMRTVAEELFYDDTAHEMFCQSIETLPTAIELSTQECRCNAPAKKGAVRCPDCKKIFPRKWNMKRHQKKNQCPASRGHDSLTAV
ncbi:hypothetical protein CEP52_009334 [Fusarium oligoseptatum]|uniref:C2H2-type domain-containing protein n=1 Tax=Fusarium oligoseptatum TaxID=2604345 RepID=A0A428TDS3_9HYPO|nr:hypothetical protein CEP52_009334 [Fusarium oligoseptatum]